MRFISAPKTLRKKQKTPLFTSKVPGFRSQRSERHIRTSQLFETSARTSGTAEALRTEGWMTKPENHNNADFRRGQLMLH